MKHSERTQEGFLIRRTAQGDEEAFEELVRSFQAPLMAFFYRSVMERQLAENLLQETFLRIFRFSGSYNPEKPARSWIFSIAANLLKDFKSHRKGRLESPTGVPEQSGIQKEGGPEQAALRSDTRRQVARALGGLSEKHRLVFILKHFHGLRYDEIATVLDCTVGTVKSRMHYAIKKLRSKLKALSESRKEG